MFPIYLFRVPIGTAKLRFRDVQVGARIIEYIGIIGVIRGIRVIGIIRIHRVVRVRFLVRSPVYEISNYEGHKEMRLLGLLGLFWFLEIVAT